MRAGFSRRDITPPLGTRMFGWGGRDEEHGCDGVHDPLYVRALWLDGGGEAVVIVGYDVLFFSRDVADRLRGAIGRRHGLAPRQVLLNTSHTHNGPTTGTWWTALFSPPDALYLDDLERATLMAVAKAQHRAENVSLRAGVASTDIAASRRKIGADGLARWEANLDNTIYSDVPVCLFDGVSGPVCALFSASCHPSTVPGHAISADYPGVAMQEIDHALGASCSLFLQGVGGDTKVRASGETLAFGTTWPDMVHAGRSLARSALEALGDLKPARPALASSETEIELPTLPVPDRAGFAAFAASVHKREMKALWADRMIARLDRGEVLPTAVPITMHGVRLAGGVRIVGLEGEAVADLGGLIAGEFGDGAALPLGYTDGCQLYLPSDRMLPEGGYEVESFYEYHQPAQLAPGIDDRLREGLRRLREGGIT